MDLENTDSSHFNDGDAQVSDELDPGTSEDVYISEQSQAEKSSDVEDGSGSEIASSQVVQDLLESVNDRLEQLAEDVQSKDETIARMQEAVAEARQDQVSVLLTPVARRLIELEAQLSKAATQDYSEFEPSKIGPQFHYFLDSVEEALDALGFVVVDSEPGQPFDARRHNALKAVPVTDPEKDKTIATVVRNGYCFAGAKKIAFPAKVIVNEYKESDVVGSADFEQEPSV